MKRNALLEQIWSGAVTLFDAGTPGEIARGVMALLPVRTISLKNAGCHPLPRILNESEELLPGLTLGDVLSEELGIDVPYGALVVFEEVAEVSEGEGKTSADVILGHLVPGTAEPAPAPERDARDKARRSAAELAACFRDGGLNEQFFGPRARLKSPQDGPRLSSHKDRAIG